MENDWENLVNTCSLDNWRQIMAGVLANGGAEGNDMAQLGNALASRLEKDEALLACACLVYICAGNQDKVCIEGSCCGKVSQYAECLTVAS